jgi:LmbE family N-acetylglucosaminyl deacetylase
MDLRSAAIVVAHPDDEVLWFSSLIAKVGRIVMCYGSNPKVIERGVQRRNVVQAYPFNTVRFLDLPEPGLWRGRSLGSVDGELARSAQEDPTFRNSLVDRLGRALQGISTVFVHNPWGEYGHDDHRRLHAAVSALQREMNLAVYVSNYVERRALGLMAAALDDGVSDVVSFPVDRAEIDPIIELYQSNSCWTWTTNWRWPMEEHFFRLGQGAAIRAAPVPFQLFDI